MARKALMTFIIDRNKFQSETGRRLHDKLKEIWDDPDFILGILVWVKGDEKRKKLLKYLDEGETDTDRIHELADDIRDGKI